LAGNHTRAGPLLFQTLEMRGGSFSKAGKHTLLEQALVFSLQRRGPVVNTFPDFWGFV
jgi:hypothetical protein